MEISYKKINNSELFKHFEAVMFFEGTLSLGGVKWRKRSAGGLRCPFCIKPPAEA